MLKVGDSNPSHPETFFRVGMPNFRYLDFRLAEGPQQSTEIAVPKDSKLPISLLYRHRWRAPRKNTLRGQERTKIALTEKKELQPIEMDQNRIKQKNHSSIIPLL